MTRIPPASPELNFCVLLDGPVTYDARVQRTVHTLSRFGQVLLLTTGGSEDDGVYFDDRVEVRPTARPVPSGMRKWLLFHRQHDHLADAALADGRNFDVVWANDYPTLFPARRIAREFDASLIYDSHEIWLETVNQFFPADAPLPKALAFRLITFLCRAIGNWEEPRLVRDVDVLITTNESFAAVFRERFHRDDVACRAQLPPANGASGFGPDPSRAWTRGHRSRRALPGDDESGPGAR